MAKILLFIALLLSTVCSAKTIKIAAIDWCPQICPSDSEKGYVIDFIKAIYEGSEYQLEIEYFPWSRAIKYVLSGKHDALLAPAKAEAPQLLYPKYSVGSQEMCFITNAHNQWQYRGVDSLNKMQIGIAIDTSIEELNWFVENHEDLFVFQPYNKDYIRRSAKMLSKGRIDAFLFTKNSTKHTLQKENVWHEYKVAGCVNSTDIFMAFTPAAKNTVMLKK